MKNILLILLSAVLFSCKSAVSESKSTGGSLNSTVYAEKFSWQDCDSFIMVNVNAPWQNASEIIYSYLLTENDILVPDSLSDLPVIKIPVQKVVLMSTTYISFLDTLNELGSVSGISGGRYIYNEALRAAAPKEVGYDQSLNYELLINLDPDVVFLYGVQSGISETIRKMEQLGIMPIVCADYLEPEPLGRSEWIKFFGLFYNKYAAADAIFESVSQQYNDINSAVSGEQPPTVFLGLPWKDTWYIAGGDSYAAHLIEDAGGVYIWNDLESTEAVPVDIEAVFAKALEADFWINPGIALSKEDILDHDERFEALSAYQQNKIYNNNKRMSDGGGNDYWESGILHPERILHDLTLILADSAQQDDTLFYYKHLK